MIESPILILRDPLLIRELSAESEARVRRTYQITRHAP